ncbi:MAG: PDDEXK nuclease domain-containing protein [Dysgonamonadaceae bacterium]|jgi:predicted nuclease of restriction endonuclease-like (RecB) superfamily|nr:PDDEXK nuclease domain-containing protein [Dysgonamonadaceae bacterium]
MTLVKKNSFEKLINSIYQTHCILHENVVKAINYNLTIRNWLIGCYIIEFEQNGEDRAKYGIGLLEEIAKKLKTKGMKGLHRRALNTCRLFYQAYPQIWLTLSAELQNVQYADMLPIVPAERLNIWLTPSAKLEDNINIPPELLLSRLSYSHFIELIRVEDEQQRFFYEVETIKNSWNIRELRRAIDTFLAFRTVMSTNKEAVIAKIKNLKPATNAEIIRNPYILEFLELEEKSEYNESELEQQILNHLQEFLIELGTGFCFEARQKRITFNNKHYRIDLVFYHKILKCNVLIDLKLNEYDYSDAGQMNLYLNYYKDNEMSEGDNPPIGIILCADKDDTLVRYSTAGMDDQLFVSKYLVKLPEKRVLENFMKREFNH